MTRPHAAEWAYEPPPWPEPDLSVLHENRRPPPELPLDVFGPFWAEWILATAASCSCPVDYVAGALLAVAGAFIGNARWVSPWGNWKEPPILWVGLVGKPSSGKSPGMDGPRDIARVLEAEIAEGFSDDLRRWQTKREAAKCARILWESEVKDAVGANSPAPEMPEHAVEPLKPARPRLCTSDITPEMLGRLLAQHPKGLLFQRDELAGWVCGFDRYGGGGGERAMWIEAFGGRSFVIDRVKQDGEPIKIPHLSVAIVGGIQPDRLSRVLLDGDDDGLAARFLFTWPEPVLLSRPTSAVNNDDATGAMRRLLSLEMGTNEQGELRPVVVPLSEDASRHFEAWHREHVTADPGGMLGGHFGKMPGLFLRLSLVIEFLWWCANGTQQPQEVSNAAAVAASCLIEDYFKPMAERTYGDAALPEGERLASVLGRWILKERCISLNVRDVYRRARLPGLKTPEKVKLAARVLEDCDWLRATPVRHGDTAGRQRDDYSVNPRLWDVPK